MEAAIAHYKFERPCTIAVARDDVVVGPTLWKRWKYIAGTTTKAQAFEDRLSPRPPRVISPVVSNRSLQCVFSFQFIDWHT